MLKWSSHINSYFEDVFPERQIYHRSRGTVRYASFSPLKQSLIVLLVGFISLWLLFTTVFFLFNGSLGDVRTYYDRENAKLSRWLEEASAKEEISRTLLEQRTDIFQKAIIDFEDRHKRLEDLLQSLENEGNIETTSLKGDGAKFLMNTSIELAEPRISRMSQPGGQARSILRVNPKLEELRVYQVSFLDRLEELAVERSERALSILELTSISLDRVDSDGMGGPLTEIASLNIGELSQSQDDVFSNRLLQVAARMAEVSEYEGIIERMPLAMPSSVPIRITSNYGLRADPFTKRSAWHSGVDLGAGGYWGRVPITSSGPGKVTFAGYRSGYGRMVEIDHGYGFKSRYGHLRSIKAKKGSIIETGHVLGTMGSSGRSTGRHLHFEVLFHDKPYDPSKFLKAGQYVH